MHFFEINISVLCVILTATRVNAPLEHYVFVPTSTGRNYVRVRKKGCLNYTSQGVRVNRNYL